MVGEPMESEINERTRVPLGVAVGAGIFVCMLVLWAGRVEWLASATANNTGIQAENFKNLEGRVNTYKDDVTGIKQDLLMIKCHLRIPDPACLRSSRDR